MPDAFPYPMQNAEEACMLKISGAHFLREEVLISFFLRYFGIFVFRFSRFSSLTACLCSYYPKLAS